MRSFEGIKEHYFKEKDINITETSLSLEVINILHSANILYVSQVTNRTEEEMLAIKSIDKDRVNEIETYLNKIGKTLRKEILEDDDIEW
jgi:DNA-directed RNA polymerase alpha subunit